MSLWFEGSGVAEGVWGGVLGAGFDVLEWMSARGMGEFHGLDGA
jgi:hypothetical protein